MERIALIILSITFLKNITIGDEFNIIKYFKYRKVYFDKYNDWLKKRPQFVFYTMLYDDYGKTQDKF